MPIPHPPCNDPPPVEALRVLDVLASAIPGRTVGAYLYGSLVAGGLRPQSDIDVMVIVDGPLCDRQRQALVGEFLKISGHCAVAGPSRPLEVTFVAIGEVAPWRFPPIRDLVFGEWLRGAFEAGRIPPASPNPDLAIVLSQLLQGNRQLSGAPAERVLSPIPASDLRRALRLTLPDIVGAAAGDERNVILTLARMSFTAATGKIVAKDAAADWAMAFLPMRLAPALATAKAAYLGDVLDAWATRSAEVEQFIAYAAGKVTALLLSEGEGDDASDATAASKRSAPPIRTIR